jgi:hypothetical protein
MPPNSQLIHCVLEHLIGRYHVPYGYVVEWALEQGHSEENAPFLLSIVGILNTIGVVSYLREIEWKSTT